MRPSGSESWARRKGLDYFSKTQIPMQAREIEGLIGQTREIVSTGADKVTGTSAALDRILLEVSALARQMEEIDLASREQAKASNDITR